MYTLFLVLASLSSSASAKKVDPPPPPAWRCGEAVSDDYSTANSALTAGKFDEAIPAFDAVLAKEPQCGLALLGSGKARMGAGKAAEAVTPLATAAGLFADKVDVAVWLGRARFAAGDDDGAIAAARAAIVLKPSSVDAQRVAQDALIHKKDLVEARKMLEAARAAANVVTWDCLDGSLAVAEGNAARAGEMLKLCDGVPDRAVYDALAAKVSSMPPAPPAAP